MKERPPHPSPLLREEREKSSRARRKPERSQWIAPERGKSQISKSKSQIPKQSKLRRDWLTRVRSSLRQPPSQEAIREALWRTKKNPKRQMSNVCRSNFFRRPA